MSTDTIAHSPEEHAAGHDAHGHDGGHDVPDSFYVKIFVALVFITAGEVSLSYAHIGRAFLPILLVLMTIKFFMVVLFFMHLRFDPKIFSRLFYAGLFLALAVYIATLTTAQFWVK
jgi:cytochrome c oxidase subunit 4